MRNVFKYKPLIINKIKNIFSKQKKNWARIVKGEENFCNFTR